MLNVYKTKFGDTLEIIADRLDIDIEKLQEANNLYYRGILREGTDIIIPDTEKYFNYYIIEKGDSIYAISRKYNINPKLLAAMNGLSMEDYIYPGQEILIPKSNYSYYLTAEGDTLKNVAKTFSRSEKEIIDENKTLYLLPDQLIVCKKTNRYDW